MLITGCAKKTNLQNDIKLNGGGTIIGNPESYLPAPGKTNTEDNEEQTLSLWCVGQELAPSYKNGFPNLLLNFLSPSICKDLPISFKGANAGAVTDKNDGLTHH
jgi:hypothetical protein